MQPDDSHAVILAAEFGDGLRPPAAVAGDLDASLRTAYSRARGDLHRVLDLCTPSWRELWGEAASGVWGVVYTRPEIVDLILDIAGYDPVERVLREVEILEPACGDGAFTKELVSRLVRSEKLHPSVEGWACSTLDGSILGVDLNASVVEATRLDVVHLLIEAGCPHTRAVDLAEKWILQADALATELGRQFDFVVGNPPYVRIEEIPKRVLAFYRHTFTTLGDRADLYVAFIEKGLQLLKTDGRLAFITANRFAKNLYGRRLRKLIAESYRVSAYVNLEHTQPFLSDVSAYPCILAISKGTPGPTLAVDLREISQRTLDEVRVEAKGQELPASKGEWFSSWYKREEPWITTSLETKELLDTLAESFPVVEESSANTRVGIGVATGADAVFVLKQKDETIEEECQIPLAKAEHLSDAGVSWTGTHLVNPFSGGEKGSLRPLTEFPGLKSYLEGHHDRLATRHISKKNPRRWYRTIDRIWPALQRQPKLLIPDLREYPPIAFDPGEYYPHHNVYWISSDEWELLALKALLKSSVVQLQVKTHSVQMRGGTLRWQAQTIRKVRLPKLSQLKRSLIEELSAASSMGTQAEIDELAQVAYGIPQRLVAAAARLAHT